MALLAFLGAGETHQDGASKHTVKQALKWLRNEQGVGGEFVRTNTNSRIFDHAWATWAMVEAHGMTGSKVFAEPARQSVAFLCKSANRSGGWSYAGGDQPSDTLVTGVAVLALHSARMAELTLDAAVLDAAEKLIAARTDSASGRVAWGVDPAGRLVFTAPDKPVVALTSSGACDAFGMLVRLRARPDAAAEWKADAVMAKGAALLVARPPRWDDGAASVDFIGWVHCASAAHEWGDDAWKAWWPALRDVLAAHQRTDAARHDVGSWDPVDAWGLHGGRVCSTALACLALETPFRYGRALGKK